MIPIQYLLSKKTREIDRKLLDMEYDETYQVLRKRFEGREDLIKELDKIYAETKLARSKSPERV